MNVPQLGHITRGRSQCPLAEVAAGWLVLNDVTKRFVDCDVSVVATADRAAGEYLADLRSDM